MKILTFIFEHPLYIQIMNLYWLVRLSKHFEVLIFRILKESTSCWYLVESSLIDHGSAELPRNCVYNAQPLFSDMLFNVIMQSTIEWVQIAG